MEVLKYLMMRERKEWFLPVILINGALSESVFVFVRIGETSGSNGGSLLFIDEVRIRVRGHIPG